MLVVDRAPRPGSPRRARRPRPDARPCTARARRTSATAALHRGHARHAADQDHVLDLVLVEARFLRASCSQICDRALRPGRRVSSSSCARVSTRCRCSASLRALEMMNGRFTSVSATLESSHLAFSAASFRRCSAMRSWRRSMPCSSRKPCDQPVDDAQVEVFAAEERVAGGADDLEHAACSRSRGSRCRTCRRRGRRRRRCGRCSCRSRRRARPRSAR